MDPPIPCKSFLCPYPSVGFYFTQDSKYSLCDSHSSLAQAQLIDIRGYHCINTTADYIAFNTRLEHVNHSKQIIAALREKYCAAFDLLEQRKNHLYLLIDYACGEIRHEIQQLWDKFEADQRQYMIQLDAFLSLKSPNADRPPKFTNSFAFSSVDSSMALIQAVRQQFQISGIDEDLETVPLPQGVPPAILYQLNSETLQTSINLAMNANDLTAVDRVKSITASMCPNTVQQAEAFLIMGKVLRKNQRYTEAVEVLNQSVVIFDQSRDDLQLFISRIALGYAQLLSGDYQSSFGNFRLAESDPRGVKISYGILLFRGFVELLFILGEESEAKNYYRKCVCLAIESSAIAADLYFKFAGRFSDSRSEDERLEKAMKRAMGRKIPEWELSYLVCFGET